MTADRDRRPRFLITTADERSWKLDRPVLFLGEWCRLFRRRDIWSTLDARVAPYHWDNRTQLYADYQYLRGFYERLLVEMTSALNDWHGVEHPLRYWRILIGPWLAYFSQIVFDRWTMVQHAAAAESLGETIILDLPAAEVIPNDMSQFNTFYCGDTWNHHIFGRIIARWTRIPWTSLPAAKIDVSSLGNGVIAAPSTQPAARRFALSLSRFAYLFQRQTDVVLASTSLPFWQEVRLNLAFRQPPARRRSPAPVRVAPDTEARSRFALPVRTGQGYEECVRALVAEQIPRVYLEGYRELVRQASRLSWPRKPKAVFTTTRHVDDEVFKAWTGEAVKNRVPLVVGQHGGHFGSGLFSFYEEHELAIADRYVTWGWSDSNAKEKPVAALPLVGRRDARWNPEGGLLLVTVSLPRYSYWMYSAPVAGQTVDYLNDQFAFARALPERIRYRLLVRLYRADFGWAQKERWKAELPHVRIDSGQHPIAPLVRNSRLYVATYNATTFLETLRGNVPTIMYWNPEHWELRPSAEKYFDSLRSVGILHDDPIAAASAVEAVWDRVTDWWMSARVQDARLAYCERFARHNPHAIRDLKYTLVGS